MRAKLRSLGQGLTALCAKHGEASPLIPKLAVPGLCSGRPGDSTGPQGAKTRAPYRRIARCDGEFKRVTFADTGRARATAGGLRRYRAASRGTAWRASGTLSLCRPSRGSQRMKFRPMLALDLGWVLRRRSNRDWRSTPIERRFDVSVDARRAITLRAGGRLPAAPQTLIQLVCVYTLMRRPAGVESCRHLPGRPQATVHRRSLAKALLGTILASKS